MNNIDIYSLAYDQKTDRYVAWTDGGSIVFISSDGETLFTKKAKSSLEGFGRLYDGGNARVPRITIAPNGDDVALIYISGKEVRKIWQYDVKTERAVLTY